MLDSLMFQTVNVYRAVYAQYKAEEIIGYNLVYPCIPASIQPASSSRQFFYQQRGSEVSHTVYSTAACNTYLPNDILQWYDLNGREHQFVVQADPINGLAMNLYVQFDCLEWPDNAKKQLNKEQVQP